MATDFSNLPPPVRRVVTGHDANLDHHRTNNARPDVAGDSDTHHDADAADDAAGDAGANDWHANNRHTRLRGHSSSIPHGRPQSHAHNDRRDRLGNTRPTHINPFRHRLSLRGKPHADGHNGQRLPVVLDHAFPVHSRSQPSGRLCSPGIVVSLSGVSPAGEPKRRRSKRAAPHLPR